MRKLNKTAVVLGIAAVAVPAFLLGVILGAFIF
jgi:hypothetical protein